MQMPAVLDEKGEQVLLDENKVDQENNSFLFRSIPSDIELRVLKVDEDSIDDE